MGLIQDPSLVLFFCGVLFQDVRIYHEAKDRMIGKWGAILSESEIIDFHHTSYYQEEMGKKLKRVFLAFDDLIVPNNLPLLKVESNRIEQELARDGKRCVNIDPGYLHLAKVVLASTKDYSHRLYLNHGIYAEVTLRFEKGNYQSLEWTYPDYREERTLAFFNHARELYCERLKSRTQTV